MRHLIVCTMALLLAGSLALAQQDGTLLTLTFENSLGGVVTMDQQAKLGLTHEQDVVFKGGGTLELAYLQRPMQEGPQGGGMPGSLALPIDPPPPDLAGVSFALAAAHSTPVGVMLTEGENGPRYSCVLWCEAGEWHEWALSLGRFTHDADSAVDPDGKLTPDAITQLVLLDMGGFLRAMTEKSPMFYSAPPADQTLWLDELKLLSKVPETKSEVPEGVVSLNTYAQPLTGVIFLGGKDVAAGGDEAEGESPCLKLEYTVPPRTILAIVHTLPAGSLAGIRALQFRAKSTGDVTLILNVDEKRGQGEANTTGHNAQVTVKGLQPWQTITVPVTDLHADANKVDPNGRLDLELVDAIMIGDVSAVGAPGDIKNTLWLADLVGVK